MHIFLTGEINVGKSTVLERLFAQDEKKKLGGFRTVCGTNSDVFIIPASYSAEHPNTAQNMIGTRNRVHCPQSFPDVFNSLGVELLSNAETCDIIIMDELGKMEEGANRFTSRVLEILDGGTQVVGVIKRKQSPFLDAVRDHPRTEIIDITIENREHVFNELKGRLQISK